MKKATRRIPSKRRAPRAVSSVLHEDPRILSEEEKHELILAHAQARKNEPREFGLGYYIAVAASCLVVMTGWWLTLGTTISSGVPQQSDPAVEALKEATEQLQASFETQSKGVKGVVDDAGNSLQQAAKLAATSTSETVNAQ